MRQRTLHARAAALSSFALVVLVFGMTSRVAAQQVVTQFSAAAGSSTDARGIRSNTVTAAPGLVFFPQSRVSLALSASGSRFAGNAWQAGGSAGVSARSPERARTALTLNGGAEYVRTSYDFTFSTLDATPALEMRLGPVIAFGGAHVASARTAVRGAGAMATPQVPVVLTSITRSARGPVFGAQWQVSNAPAPLQLSYREERNRVLGTIVLDRSASAELALGPLVLAGSAGRRLSPMERLTFASGTAVLSLGQSVSLQGSAGRYPSSYLTGASGGRFISVGVVLRAVRPRAPQLPRVHGVPAVRGGATRLSLRAPDATRVELAGDWNGWKPVPAKRAANGVWYADVRLQPGEYRYAFRVDGGAWRVPEGAVTSDDGFGGKSAYITVATAANRRSNHHQEER